MIWWTLYQCEPMLTDSKLRKCAASPVLRQGHPAAAAPPPPLLAVRSRCGGLLMSSACLCSPRAALAYTIKHITYEDENTRFLDIGPVNKVRSS